MNERASSHKPASAGHGHAVPDFTKYDGPTYVLAAIALAGVLLLHLLSALLAGLLVHQLIHIVARRLRSAVGVRMPIGKIAALTLIATVTILALVFAVIGLTGLLSGRSESLLDLMQRMADEIDTLRTHLPLWVQDYLPSDAQQLQSAAAQWLRQHADQLQNAGTTFGTVLFHIIVGMIIGAMIALGESISSRQTGPLAIAMARRATTLGNAFRRVVFAQVRISALNTCLTALYILGLLPLLGIHLPLAKTIIAVTFIVGLLPVLGNLISNTVIVVVSLSVSIYAAIGSLIFLVVIHKLEYFLNARIIGSKIHAHAWELLLAMLVMDAAFGIPGVIAAPIFYAYIKDELTQRRLI
jgi:predicted PurR-regulated permease PerM